jgi:hypothetical protein
MSSATITNVYPNPTSARLSIASCPSELSRNEGCQEPALRSGRKAPSSFGRGRRPATRRTCRSVSIAPPQAGRGMCGRRKALRWRRLRRITSGIDTWTSGDAREDHGPNLSEAIAWLRARRAWSPPRRGATKKFAVLNTVLILPLERWRDHKPLKSLARPERFELPTPRFVVWCFPWAVTGDGESPCRRTTRRDMHSASFGL